MLIEITTATSISGQPAKAGQVVDVSNSDARILLAMGKAIVATEPVAPTRGKRQPKPTEP
jgi:conjugal transfer/entry exclusion protein